MTPRATFSEPVFVQSPVAGSYNAAFVTAKFAALRPPHTSTLPFGNSVAVCCWIARFRKVFVTHTAPRVGGARAMIKVKASHNPCNFSL